MARLTIRLVETRRKFFQPISDGTKVIRSQSAVNLKPLLLLAGAKPISTLLGGHAQKSSGVEIGAKRHRIPGPKRPGLGNPKTKRIKFFLRSSQSFDDGIIR